MELHNHFPVLMSPVQFFENFLSTHQLGENFSKIYLFPYKNNSDDLMSLTLSHTLSHGKNSSKKGVYYFSICFRDIYFNYYFCSITYFQKTGTFDELEVLETKTPRDWKTRNNYNLPDLSISIEDIFSKFFTRPAGRPGG